MIEKWFREELTQEVQSHQKRLESILAHKKRMEEGAKRICDVLPEIRLEAEKGYFNFEFVKTSRVDNGPLTEFKSVITKGREVFYVEYSTEDYPTIDIRKGFEIHRTGSENYEKPKDFFFKPSIWKLVDVNDKAFKQIAGLAIYGNLETLTENAEIDDLGTALFHLSEQVI